MAKAMTGNTFVQHHEQWENLFNCLIPESWEVLTKGAVLEDKIFLQSLAGQCTDKGLGPNFLRWCTLV